MGKARIAVALCVLAIVACAAGYLWGKRTVPARIEDRIVLDEREYKTWKARAESAEQVIANFVPTDRQTASIKWKYHPSGALAEVEQTKERSSDVRAASSTASLSKVDTAGTLTAQRSIESTRIIVYPPVRKWGVSAIAGVDLKLNRQFGLQIQRDLGPFTVGAWALSSKTAGVSLGFRF